MKCSPKPSEKGGYAVLSRLARPIRDTLCFPVQKWGPKSPEGFHYSGKYLDYSCIGVFLHSDLSAFED